MKRSIEAMIIKLSPRVSTWEQKTLMIRDGGDQMEMKVFTSEARRAPSQFPA